MQSDLQKSTLLVIPVYNHGSTLRQVVERALQAGWPVLVVDDGSTDCGPETLRRLNCQVHQLPSNQGKGVALLAGARQAAELGYRAMLTVDADGQLDPLEGRRLVEAAADQWPCLVIGARRMDTENVPKSSLFGRAFSNFWVRLESGLDLPDTQSGMRLYPVEELLELSVSCRRYDFEVESLVHLIWAGLPVLSAEISVYYPPPAERQSHFHQFRDNFRLTMLHTRLVLRALNPMPHRNKNLQRRIEEFDVSVLHPVRLLKKLCLEHTSSLLLAVAVWMGIFLGALPLIAVHTVTIIYVTHRLHLNKVAAVAASQLCAPPLVPVLCIQAGYFMRHGEFLLDVSWEIAVVQLHQRLWEWLLGSLVVGPLLGLLGAGMCYLAISRLRRVTAGSGCQVVDK